MQQQFMDKINSAFNSLFENSPLRDVDKNIKAIVMAIFAKLDLVTREEFDTQQKVLLATRKKLEELEQKISALEQNHPL